MSKLRLALLCAFGVLALSAIGSATASAANCPSEKGGDKSWCINGTEFTGEETVTTKGGVQKLKAGITIECKKVTGAATILQENSVKPENSDVELKYTECKVVNNAKCTVTNVGGTPGTILVGPEIDSEVIEVGGVLYDVFFPSEGEKFVTLTVAGTGCLVAGEYEVTGKTAGESNKKLGEQAKVQTLTFSTASSEAAKVELKLKGVKATLEGKVENELSGAHKGQEFGVMES